MIAEWLGNSQRSVPSLLPSDNVGVDLSINEIVLAYWQLAKTYYSKDGRPTKELSCMREALRPLRQLYGHTSARNFGPKALKAVRQRMIDRSLSRGLINRRVGRIKRVFKWAVAEELIPPTVHHGLQAVAGLGYGRTKDSREVTGEDSHKIDPKNSTRTPYQDSDGNANRRHSSHLNMPCPFVKKYKEAKANHLREADRGIPLGPSPPPQAITSYTPSFFCSGQSWMRL